MSYATQPIGILGYLELVRVEPEWNGAMYGRREEPKKERDVCRGWVPFGKPCTSGYRPQPLSKSMADTPLWLIVGNVR